LAHFQVAKIPWSEMSFRLLGLLALAEEAYAEANRLFLLGSSLTSGQVAELIPYSVPALVGLRYAERGQGNLAQARQRLVEILQLTIEKDFVEPLWYIFPLVALLMNDQGEPERAVELYALASRVPFVANSRWFEDVAGRHITTAAKNLPPKVVAAAKARGRERDLWETAAELLAEF
jgi:hypothetical protein